MSDWIDRDQQVGQSTSNLPVLPPTSEEKTAQPPPQATPAGSGQSVVTEGDETHVYVNVPRKPGTVASPPAAIPVSGGDQPAQLPGMSRFRGSPPPAGDTQRKGHARANPQAAGSGDLPGAIISDSQPVNTLVMPDGSVVEQFEDNRPLSERLFYGLPSWLVSFIVHLTLLLLLALLSLNAGSGPQMVELQMAQAEAFDNMRVFDLALDQEMDRVEDSEQLEMTEEDELAFESEIDLKAAEFADLKSGMDLSASDQNSLEGAGAKLSRGDGKSARFFGAGAIGTKFVFIIDCSGSMEDEYRWDTAKRELKDAIEGLTRKQKYYVFLYNSHAYGMTTKKPKLLPAIGSTRKKTFNWLAQQYPIGDTRPWMAVKTALGMEPDAIFFLSDGELKDDTVRLLRSVNRPGADVSNPSGKQIELQDKIPIHTVFLGKGVGKQTMREIANENNGSFTQVRK